ncbi:MAG: glutamine-hydrolyzing carbamoyl-phosphate synthase small subunit [Acidimicrobiales bacterium]
MTATPGDTSLAPALLVLADGEVFEGEAAGAVAAVSTGELVFNTALSGYQEVMTDPSYAGQVVAFTYPHIGNYGVNATDDESARAHCSGVVVRDLTPEPSNWRADGALDRWLTLRGVPAITGVDTRRLTRHLRDKGAMPCAFGTASEGELHAAAASAPGTDGRDLVAGVTTVAPYVRGTGPKRIVAYDFGVKETMLRHLERLGTVTVVPASTSASDALALDPDGVFLSNGPGDPAALGRQVAAIADILGRAPVFGICLGHQLLCAALGGSTYKLAFGHHGTNHPVKRLADGTVEITSQNHSYAVTDVPDADITHVNLNDGVIEGIRCRSANAVSVQYHPEAGPGPHDAGYLFSDFAQMLG